MAIRNTSERLLTERETKWPLPPRGKIIIKRMRVFCGVKWPTINSRTILDYCTVLYWYYTGTALTLQRSIFRGNPTNFLTFIGR